MKNTLFVILSLMVFSLLFGCHRKIHKKSLSIDGTYHLVRVKNESLNDSTKIMGYVISKLDSTSLPRVNVYTLDPTIGEQTDLQGYFDFTINSGTHEFGAQYVGFDDLIIPNLNCNPNERIIIIIELGTTIYHM